MFSRNTRSLLGLGLAGAGLTVALLIMTAGSAAWGAVPVPITNAGFENPALDDGVWTTTIPNWSQGSYDVTNPTVWVVGNSGAGVYNVSTSEYTSGLAPEGENMGYATSLAGYDCGIKTLWHRYRDKLMIGLVLSR